MQIKTRKGIVTALVVTPTRGRARMFNRRYGPKGVMRWLDQAHNLFGFDDSALLQDANYRVKFEHAESVRIHNPGGSTTVAREVLRAHLRNLPMKYRPDFIIENDDNAVFTQADTVKLVRAAAEWRGPVVMAGIHRMFKFWNRDKVRSAESRYGLRSFEGVSMPFRVFPAGLYLEYRAPVEMFGQGDRHIIFTLLRDRLCEFRICADAELTKVRHQKGGQGSLEHKRRNNRVSNKILLRDFPELKRYFGKLTSAGEFAMRWSKILHHYSEAK